MDINQLLILLEMQKTASAWRIGNPDEKQASGDDALLFTDLLQAAMQGVTNTGTKSAATQSAVNGGPKQNARGPSGPQTGAGPGNYEQIITAMSQKYGVDPNLIREVIEAESAFNPKAVSPVGAEGLMQLMPDTAISYGVQNSFDPVQNVDGGTHFFRDLLDRFQGNIPLALAAYNAGPGAVDKYHGVPPYQETQNYVKKITAGLNKVDTGA